MKYVPILEEKDMDAINYLSSIDCHMFSCDMCPLFTKNDTDPCIRDIAINLLKELKERRNNE